MFRLFCFVHSQFFLCKQIFFSFSYLSRYSLGKNSGLVIDSGESFTQIVSVIDGYAIPNGAVRINVGGRKNNEIFSLFLRKNGIRLMTSGDKEVIRELKEKNCFISTENAYKTIQIALPDGQQVQLNGDALRIPELLFYPEKYGLENESLLQLCQSSLSGCDINARQKLLDNVIVAGGNTLTKGKLFIFFLISKGFCNKLFMEMKNSTKESSKVSLYCPKDRFISCWKGASILASMSLFDRIAVTSQQYAENPASILSTKFY